MRIGQKLRGRGFWPISLQGLNFGNATDTPENQFNDNNYRFQEMVQGKIKNGEVVNWKIVIDGDDAFDSNA